jgi:serine/threonine-protein kinase
MAEVLLARRVGPADLEVVIAVKRVRPERAHDPDLVRMLVDEARNAAAMTHRRIVQVFDIEVRDGVVELSMEYLHGKTLEALLEREPRLPVFAAVSIAVAIAEGLHHAHTRQPAIIHRDVAPSNVMVTYDGNVKLIDFGIAKSANNISNTVFGTFKGRLGYSSPEQARCEVADARSDVYSLAILLYEMTTGARAFVAADERDMLARMTAANIAPPSTIVRDYPRELEAIVMKGLAADRDHRDPTALAMQIELEAFARSQHLNLSDGALAKLMYQLYSEDLQTWIRAKADGMTLDHFVYSQVVRNTVDVEAESKTTVLPPRKRRQRMPVWVLPAVVVGLLATAFAVTRWLLS